MKQKVHVTDKTKQHKSNTCQQAIIKPCWQSADLEYLVDLS